MMIGPSKAVTSVAFSPDGSTLVAGSDDNTVKLWRWSMRECLKTLTKHLGRVTSVAFSPDGSTLASGSNDRTVKLWGCRAIKEELALESGGIRPSDLPIRRFVDNDGDHAITASGLAFLLPEAQ